MTRSATRANIADLRSPCNFASMLLRWFLPIAALISTPALAKDEALCGALENLKREAETSGPQRVEIFKQEAMTFACGRTVEAQAQVDFCDAAAGPVGLEFTHVFPWLIHGCLRDQHIKPELELADQYTGVRHRKKIVHLWAGWPDGVRMDIRYRPTGDFGADRKFRDYWGAYELVVWQPRSSP